MKVLDARRLVRGRKCRFWSQFNFNIFPAKVSLRVVRKELSTAISRKGSRKTVHSKIPKVIVGGFEFTDLWAGLHERASVAPYLRKCGNLPSQEIFVDAFSHVYI